MEVFGIARFQRFFRQAAGIDIDKSDVRRFDDFVNDRIYALLLRAVAIARPTAATWSSRKTSPSPRASRRPCTPSGLWTRTSSWTRSSSS